MSHGYWEEQMPYRLCRPTQDTSLISAEYHQLVRDIRVTLYARVRREDARYGDKAHLLSHLQRTESKSALLGPGANG